MSTEDVLFEVPGVKVTTTRVIISGTTYAVANVTSIGAVRDTSLRSKGIAVIVLGVCLVVAKLFSYGLVALIVGGLMAWYGSVAILVLTTGAAERHALRSRNEAFVVDIASAINLAIMKRSALPR